MMLLERWVVAAIVALGLVSMAGDSRAQSTPRKPKTTQPAPKAVQPDDGPPPDQAVTPDQAAPLDQGVPDPGPPPDQTAPPEQTPPPGEAKLPEPTPADQARKEEPAQEDRSKGEPIKEEPVKPQEPQPAPAEALQGAAPQPAPGPPPSPEQAQLERDTAQLLRLVQELKLEVEKAGSNTLSLVALRKADEIQRLSKSLKERMKERGQVPQSRPQ